MRTFIKQVITQAVRINWIWDLLENSVIPFALYARGARRKTERLKTVPDSWNHIFAKMTVLNGVFAGMKYPEMESIGSALFPKLIGSYEKEIEPLISRHSD